MPVSDYAKFINDKITFTPRLIVKIGGEDVSDLYVEGSLKTDQVLDTPGFNVWTTGTLRLTLRNEDNRFNTRNTDNNFFTDLGRDASGWRTFLIVSVVFENDEDAPKDEDGNLQPVTFFSGFVEQVIELPHVRSAEIFALDFSAHLQQAPLDNFGVSFRHDIVGPDGTPNYSELSPIYNFPDNAAPISYRSVSISLRDDDDNDVDVTVLTSLPEEGVFGDYKYAGIDYDAGAIHFGSEPPRGSSTRLNVEYKAVYRYRTPEALIFAMLEHTRIYDGILTDTEKIFAESLLKSPIVESALPVVSSHGRPVPRQGTSEFRFYPVIRWIESGFRNRAETFYFGGDRNLLTYVRRNDQTGDLDVYEILTQCPDTDGASILQFRVVGEDFYVLTANGWNGRRAKLWWVSFRALMGDPAASDADRDTKWRWKEVVNAQATVAHFYDDLAQAGGQQDVVADNRKNFVQHGNYIYYLYDNMDDISDTSRRVGLRRVGLRSIDKTTNPYTISEPSPETLFTIGVDGRFSIDFTIVGDEIYVFYCLRRLDGISYFRVRKRAVDASGDWVPPGAPVNGDSTWTHVYEKQWAQEERFRPAMVSDVVARGSGSDLKFYFVLTYSRRVTRRGFAELCRLYPGGTEEFKVLKSYDDMLFAPRSLVVHDEDNLENIYFVEGQWASWLSHLTDYPTFDDCGHFFRLDPMDTIWDLGPAWRSYRDKNEPGRGMHTAFGSNIHRAMVVGSDFTAGTLHFIAGYGLSARYPSQDDRNGGRGSVQTWTNSREVQRQDNWVWLQYGKKLSTKVPVFPTNGKYVWPLIEELARIVDYEVGWVPGDREIADFKQTYPDLTLSPKSYLFFRPRGESTVEVALDESVYVNLGSQLDTVQIFNSVSMTFGGHIHFSEELLDDEDDGQADLVRNFHIFTDCLSGKDRGWAEAICDRVLSRQKERRLKTRLPLKFSPHLQLGDLLEITSEYHSLVERPYRVTEVVHDTARWRTEIECREDLVVTGDLLLPVVEDKQYIKDQSIAATEILPVATEGSGSYTYSLSDPYNSEIDFNQDSLLPGVVFDSETRGLTGTPTVETVLVVRYRVTDDSDPVQSVFQDFQIRVIDANLSLSALSSGLLHIRKDCEQKIIFPAATGGVPPYSYEMVDFELDDVAHPGSLYFDGAFREIRGIEESGYIGKAKYRVLDLIGQSEETAEFPVLVEESGIWSGLYYASNKVGLLHNGASGQGQHREYDYVAGDNGRKARSIPDSTTLTILGDFSITHTGVTFWNGCCATGNFRVFVGQAGGNGFGSVFEGTSNVGTPVNLGAGDWRDVVELSSGSVGFFDFKTGAFRAYSVSSSGLSRSSADDIELKDSAGNVILVDLVSSVIHSSKIWGVVKDSDRLVVWDSLTGNLVDPTTFPVMIEGITDWVGIAWTGTHFLLVRAESTRLLAVSVSGERSVENDLPLYG